MNRRVGGIVMLVSVLLGAAITGNAAPKVVTGTAVIGTVYGAPHVGACLIDDPGEVAWAYDPNRTLAAVPALEFIDDCQGSSYGEVVAVLRGLPPQRTLNERSTAGPGFEMWQRCPAAAAAYVGAPPPTDFNFDHESGWASTVTTNISFAGPDPLQRAFGQNWIACILVGARGPGAMASYSGVARDAVHTGRLPTALTRCTNDESFQSGTGPCTAPHTVEGLATGVFLGSSPGMDPTTTCRQLVETLTGMPDVTAGGRLRIVVQLQRFDANGMTEPRVGPLPKKSMEYGNCGVQTVGPGQITGTLIGLGSNPVLLGP